MQESKEPEDADRYRLHTYFPRSSQLDNTNMFSEPFYASDAVQLKHEKLTYILLSFKCDDLHLLGGKYYNNKNFSYGNELFSTFVELPRKTACAFLATEVARDRKFWETYRVNIGLTEGKRNRAAKNTLDTLVTERRQKYDKFVRDHRGEVCTRTVMTNSLQNCPRGYKLEDEHPEGKCCIKDTEASTRRPLVWNQKVEIQVLHSIRDALLETMKYNVARRLFESSSGKEFEMKDCDDTEVEKPRALLSEKAADAKQKLKAFGQFLKEGVASTYSSIKEYGAAIKRELARFEDVKILLDYSSKAFGLAENVIDSIYGQFVTGQYEAVLLRNIKKRLLETLYQFILQQNLLKVFKGDDDKFKPLESDENYRQSFSDILIHEWKKLKKRRRTEPDVAEQLWDLFYSTFKEDETMYAEVFSDTIGTCLEVLNDLSFGISNIVFNTANRATNEVIATAFENVFVNFFYMEMAEDTDIVEHLFTVFDVSQHLCKKAAIVRKYPVLLEWRSCIDSQILGAAKSKQQFREQQQHRVMDTLWKTNQFINSLKSENTRDIMRQDKSPYSFRHLQDMITQSRATEESLPVRAIRRTLALTDESRTQPKPLLSIKDKSKTPPAPIVTVRETTTPRETMLTVSETTTPRAPIVPVSETKSRPPTVPTRVTTSHSPVVKSEARTGVSYDTLKSFVSLRKNPSGVFSDGPASGTRSQSGSIIKRMFGSGWDAPPAKPMRIKHPWP